MSSNKERAKKALNAMKLLGFSKKQATPVLKELLNIFNNNWEPIEDECYRALADAILDRQDNKQTPPSQQVIILLSTSLTTGYTFLSSPLTPYCCSLSIFFIRATKQHMRTRSTIGNNMFLLFTMTEAKMIMKRPW
jgi:hypothetical protein